MFYMENNKKPHFKLIITVMKNNYYSKEASIKSK